ncbi:MAG: hypothetical protein R3E32_00850 [Chitinophagales bacterium]
MTYSKINISNKHEEVPNFSFKLILLILTVIAALSVNILIFNTNNSSNLEANSILSPITTEMVILVK